MVNFDQVRKLLASAREQSPCVRECVEALADAAYEELGPGRMSAHEAIATFEIRARTAREKGISIAGTDETLRTLRSLAPAAEVQLFHFSGPKRVFTVFVDGHRLAGCISVHREPAATD